MLLVVRSISLLAAVNLHRRYRSSIVYDTNIFCFWTASRGGIVVIIGDTFRWPWRQYIGPCMPLQFFWSDIGRYFVRGRKTML